MLIFYKKEFVFLNWVFLLRNCQIFISFLENFYFKFISDMEPPGSRSEMISSDPDPAKSFGYQPDPDPQPLWIESRYSLRKNPTRTSILTLVCHSGSYDLRISVAGRSQIENDQLANVIACLSLLNTILSYLILQAGKVAKLNAAKYAASTKSFFSLINIILIKEKA